MNDNSVAAATDNVSDSTFAVLLGMLGGLILVLVAIGILWYVFSALGYYKLAKNRDIKHAWIAWIPICQEYLLGDLIGNKVWGFGFANWILVIGTIIASVLTSVAEDNQSNTVLLLLILAYVVIFFVYRMTALYRLFKIYTDKATLLLVLSIIFHFLTPIFIFSIRNRKPLHPEEIAT